MVKPEIKATKASGILKLLANQTAKGPREEKEKERGPAETFTEEKAPKSKDKANSEISTHKFHKITGRIRTKRVYKINLVAL
jgi:hypothetical protein